MSSDEKNEGLAQIHEFQAILAKYVDTQRERQAAEAARRARLTPEQRAAEDRAHAERLASAERQKLARKLAKMGGAIKQHDTWTIEKFAWLLAAEDPEADEPWGFFSTRSGRATEQHKHFRDVLESCMDTRLMPVNPHDTPALRRFTVQSLILVAREKRLGCFEVLADMVAASGGIRPPPDRIAVAAVTESFVAIDAKPAATPDQTAVAAVTEPTVAVDAKPAAVADSPTAQVTSNRETQRKRRRRDLRQCARTIAEAGEGTADEDFIDLSIHGVELNRRFREAFPEWKQIQDKTLESDRTNGRPRIRVPTGRPRSNNSI